jgi:hypothetical protein
MRELSHVVGAPTSIGRRRAHRAAPCGYDHSEILSPLTLCADDRDIFQYKAWTEMEWRIQISGSLAPLHVLLPKMMKAILNFKRGKRGFKGSGKKYTPHIPTHWVQRGRRVIVWCKIWFKCSPNDPLPNRSVYQSTGDQTPPDRMWSDLPEELAQLILNHYKADLRRRMRMRPVIEFYGTGKTFCEMCDKKKQRVAWFRHAVLHDGRNVYSACPRCMKRWV